MKEKTAWFTGVNPEHPGVYQTRVVPFDIGWSRWDGKLWSYQRETMEGAALSLCVPTAKQDKEWRGLAENPRPAVTWLPEEEVIDL
jgi:hypothetical protein